MASRASVERLYQELLDTYGPKIATAFRAAIDDLRSAANLQQLLTAVEANDIQGAIDALHLDPAAYGQMLDQIQTGYTASGQTAATLLPARAPGGLALVFRFDSRNLRAEGWLRSYGADLVTRIIDDQRTAVRQRLVAGMTAGDNPRATALDIVGRISRSTGKREGGILGLSAPQEQYLRSARAELVSADPALLANYLSRARRDRRFDRSVAKALREKRPLDPQIAAKAATAYERRLVQLRGETIGRTEALTALNAAQHESLQQAVDSGQVQATQVRRVWQTAGDNRVRDTHQTLNGETAGLGEAFISPSGAALRYPGDPQAPAAERINCRCWTMPRIDWAANVR